MFFPSGALNQAIYVLILSIIRYALFGGIAFVLFYVIYKRKPFLAKIQEKWPAISDYRREIGYSVISFLIFAIVPLILHEPHVKPYTTIYKDIHQYGIVYFILAFPLMILIHDTWFYWTHRAMHHPCLFRFFHVVHHKSTNPSPWASFSFQPTEAFMQASIIIVFSLTIPVHFIHIFTFLVFMTVYNVYGHLGFELYPKGFNKHWLGKWFNTSVNHNMHHQHFNGNYGLYFTFWDRLMKTTRKEYDEKFDKITGRNGELRRKRQIVIGNKQ